VTDLQQFREVWIVDSEFGVSPGNRHEPRCFVGYEYFSGRTVRLFHDEFYRHAAPPFSIAPDSLTVAYLASAELNCYLSLGWQLPPNVLDLYAEFRNRTNGLPTPAGNSLLGAMAYFGLNPMDAVEKEEMRQLALRGGYYSSEEREALLDYCQADVMATGKLLRCMLPQLNLPQGLNRGRYMCAVARMESTGVPIDVETWEVLVTNWENIQDQLISRVDRDYGVFDGRTFKVDRMEQYVARNQIQWPRHESGRLKLDEDTFKFMASVHSEIEQLRQLRKSLAQTHASRLAVGADGRNRCLLSPFSSRTGRNQPSNSQFIFGLPCWMRKLIRPREGWGLAYLDYEQEEVGIGAALSGDQAMQEVYQSDDCYVASAKRAGRIPSWGTRETHASVRDQFKTVMLCAQYGMGEISLAQRLKQSTIEARELLLTHQEAYRKYWDWSDRALDFAMSHLFIQTAFGWTLRIDPHARTDAHLFRSIRNFPVQANGAEILRVACCLATERGVSVCCPIHDALLIESPLESLDHVVEKTRAAMIEASSIVLDGFPLRVEAKTIRYPERFQDERGTRMWEIVQDCLATLSRSDTVVVSTEIAPTAVVTA
jgi:DNA polymerase I